MWGYYGDSEGEKEGSPTLDNTYQLKYYMPPHYCKGEGLAHVEVVNLCYLSWSAGVSCPICVGVGTFLSSC